MRRQGKEEVAITLRLRNEKGVGESSVQYPTRQIYKAMYYVLCGVSSLRVSGTRPCWRQTACKLLRRLPDVTFSAVIGPARAVFGHAEPVVSASEVEWLQQAQVIYCNEMEMIM